MNISFSSQNLLDFRRIEEQVFRPSRYWGLVSSVLSKLNLLHSFSLTEKGVNHLNEQQQQHLIGSWARYRYLRNRSEDHLNGFMLHLKWFRRHYLSDPHHPNVKLSGLPYHHYQTLFFHLIFLYGHKAAILYGQYSSLYFMSTIEH